MFTSLVSSLPGSAMASPRVGPLTRAMIGPSCKPLDRSHSQALSRAGRPNVVRKPLGSSTPESGKAAARVPGRDARELRGRARDPVHRVEQHLGRQPAGHRMRVVDLVVGVPLVRLDRQLIGPRLADQPHDVPHVEAALNELLGQVVEQLGIARRVARADVVERLDDPDARTGSPRAG